MNSDMSKTNAFLRGFLSIFDLELDPTTKQSMPRLFSGELERRLVRRWRDPKSRTPIPIWEGVGKLLQSAMSEYERTQSNDTGSQNHHESGNAET